VIGLLTAQPERGDGLSAAVNVATAAAAGAAVMYLLDPDRGRGRRASLRDQVVHAAHQAERAAGATSRDLGHRARGVVAELRGRLVSRPVNDVLLGERVRTRIGAVIGHAGAVEASVDDGIVTLSGPVLADEVERLVHRVRGVRGVKRVDNHLEVHAEPGNVPGLQGRPRPPRGGEVFELAQARWSPTAYLMTGFAGAAVVLWILRRFLRGE
jgi:hypothetical protein